MARKSLKPKGAERIKIPHIGPRPRINSVSGSATKNKKARKK